MHALFGRLCFYGYCGVLDLALGLTSAVVILGVQFQAPLGQGAIVHVTAFLT